MAVALAVEDDFESPTRGAHWLMASGGDVDDREPTKRKTNARGLIEVRAFIIWAAMHEAARHRLEYARRFAQPSFGIDESCESTHIRISSLEPMEDIRARP